MSCNREVLCGGIIEEIFYESYQTICYKHTVVIVISSIGSYEEAHLAIL
jgi:hypothetical protein